MNQPLPSFSSSLRLSKKLDYCFGAVLFLATTVVFAWVTGKFILASGVEVEEITALTIFLFCTFISLFFSLWSWLYILRSHLTVDNYGVTYQGPVYKTVLSWKDIEGFASTEESLYLVYNASKIPKRPKWVDWFIKSQPMIFLSQFTNEWPPREKPMGPLMSTIFLYAQHLFICEEVGADNLSGVK